LGAVTAGNTIAVQVSMLQSQCNWNTFVATRMW